MRSGLLIILLTLTGCQPACHDQIEPTLICPLPVQRFKTMPSSFSPLTASEKAQEWSKELLIGDAFARECDFYRAITAYKRGLVLLHACEGERHLQFDYNILLCYYLGGKYQDALNIFEASELSQANCDFPAFNHLLLVVYDCYLLTHQEEKAECVRSIIQKFSPETAQDLLLYESVKNGDVEETRFLIAQHRDGEEMAQDFCCYEQFAKSPSKARLLNAVLPGAGYYYVGQKRSAVTSFLINALFTAASYQFFRHGYPAAGIITASIEAGWYLGGINGAGIEAKEFNNRLFEGMGRKILVDHACFPVLMFETSF